MSASSRDIFVDKSSSISHANSGNSAVVEPLLALPRFFSTGFWLLCLALILKVFFAGGDMQSVVITLIPLQLFWAFGVNRLSQITADKFGTSRPLSESMIVLLTAVSLFCVPRLDDYPLSLYRIDPFFWLWMAVQLGVPFVLFLRLKQETLKMQNKKANAFTYLQPAVMSLFANMYLSVLFFLPAPAMFTMIFLPGWTMCQLGVLAIYNFLLRDAFAADLKMVKAIKSKIKQASLLSQDYPVIMDYKAFGGLRRWLSERFSSSANTDSASKSKNSQIMVATMIAPILLLVTFIAVFNYFGHSCTNVIANAGGIATTSSGVAAGSNAVYNSIFIQGLVATVLFSFAAGFIAYLINPTHFLIGRKGIKFLYKRGLWSSADELPWAAVKLISYENPSDSRLFANKKIVFQADAVTKKIDLSSIDSVDDKEAIIRGIEKWAPNIARDAEVEQLLLPASNHSYTELWLQALSAPPKRERLKPLIEKSLLQNGRYQVEGAIGVGGQGSAYTALDRLSGATVVLKEFILPVFVNVKVRKSALEQFENEAKILRQLNNEQIVKLLDFFVEDHRAYLVLEHIDGTSLRTLVEKKGACNEAYVRSLALQMCHILQYLHGLSPPVVHRDFTPDNLILRNDGKLKLIDFNVAQQVEETTTGTVVGKHAYLPPEQFRGETVSQSDLYALGATLHFLLTGDDPEPISVSQPKAIVPNVSQEFSDIVAKATCLSEEERYQSAKEIELSILCLGAVPKALD
ncbi:MAG: serine/threonine-protein kinase [Candidatus Obscuribacterales bacterium]|jgi:tRNA A-37 threonylcarbamoyl transferase component Bud32